MTAKTQTKKASAKTVKPTKVAPVEPVKAAAKKPRRFMTTAPTESLRKKVSNMSKIRPNLEVGVTTKRSGGTTVVAIKAVGDNAQAFAFALLGKVENMGAAWKNIVFDGTTVVKGDGKAATITVKLTPRHKLEGPKVHAVEA